MPRLSWNDKLTIEKLLKQRVSIPNIARKLGVHYSTIYREVKRGQVEVYGRELEKIWVYSPEISEERHREAVSNMDKPLKIGHDYRLAEWLVKVIGEEHFSPAAACALMGKTPETTFSVTLCRQTVYKYIDKGYLWPLTNKQLRYKGYKKRKYNQVKRASRASRGDSIEKRPSFINQREDVGHWEMDGVEGKKKTRQTLLVLTERVSRKEIIIPMINHTSESVVQALDRLELQYGDNFRRIFKTITVDNGKEFMDLQGMQESKLRPGEQRTHIYYCHPCNPGERGSNEKQNQLIRWFFPKGTDFSKVSRHDIKTAMEWINNYPRKILNWRSSEEVFDELVGDMV